MNTYSPNYAEGKAPSLCVDAEPLCSLRRPEGASVCVKKPCTYVLQKGICVECACSQLVESV